MHEILVPFFKAHMVEIFFIYGLAFFITGVILGLESSRVFAPQVRALPLLAAFCLVHGAHEWIEMFQLITPKPVTAAFLAFRILVLCASFLLLAEFGLRTLVLEGQGFWRSVRWVLIAIFVIGFGIVWLLWGPVGVDVWLALDAWCRYSLAVPGAVLAAVGLFRQGRRLVHEREDVSFNLLVVGMAFLFYGVPGQVFVGSSPLPPSTVLNTEFFLNTFCFPIQLLRSTMASLALLFTVRAVRQLEQRRHRRMQELSSAREEAQQKLIQEVAEQERLRRKLLHQTVRAQEQERQHIARELHDESSQALTAILYGLAATEEGMVRTQPPEVLKRVAALRQLVEQVMDNLRQLTVRLRPAVLDELGLVPALISYADDCSKRFPFIVDVEVSGSRRRLSSEVETVMYRIAQEAITNVVKHAEATTVSVLLHFDQDKVVLDICDDGRGMDVESAERTALGEERWGLAGIRERVQLVEGYLVIDSSVGSGTNIKVEIPILGEEETHGRNSVDVGR